MCEAETAFLVHIADHVGVDARKFQILTNLNAVFDLQHQSRFFAEQHLDRIRFAESRETQVHAADVVGKGHLQQRSDQTSSRNIVPRKNLSSVDQLLYGGECLDKVVGRLDRGYVRSDKAQRLCEAAATEIECRAAHVDIDQLALGMFQCRGYGFPNVRNFGCSGDDNRSRCINQLAVTVFLGHRKRVLTSRDVDSESLSVIACRFNGAI